MSSTPMAQEKVGQITHHSDGCVRLSMIQYDSGIHVCTACEGQNLHCFGDLNADKVDARR